MRGIIGKLLATVVVALAVALPGVPVVAQYNDYDIYDYDYDTYGEDWGAGYFDNDSYDNDWYYDYYDHDWYSNDTYYHPYYYDPYAFDELGDDWGVYDEDWGAGYFDDDYYDNDWYYDYYDYEPYRGWEDLEPGHWDIFGYDDPGEEGMFDF